MQDSPPVRQAAADGKYLSPDQMPRQDGTADLPGPEALSRLLAESDRRGRELELHLVAERRSYELGYEAGHHDGYEQAAADMDRAWHAAADPIARARRTITGYDRPALTPAEILDRSRKSWAPLGLGDPPPSVAAHWRDRSNGPTPWDPAKTTCTGCGGKATERICWGCGKRGAQCGCQRQHRRAA